METSTILFIVLSLWLTGLTGFLLWLVWILRSLLKDSREKDFIKTFKKIEEIQKSNSKEIDNLQKGLNLINEEILEHIQKVGLVKFNPFNETGGDHSFSLALLDGKKNGIIITSLHTRESTRMYIKDVKRGKSSIELSSEEKKAIDRAYK